MDNKHNSGIICWSYWLKNIKNFSLIQKIFSIKTKWDWGVRKEDRGQKKQMELKKKIMQQIIFLWEHLEHQLEYIKIASEIFKN